MNSFFFFCVAQQRNAMGSHHDSYDIIRILHALEFSLHCARVCSDSNKTHTIVRLLIQDVDMKQGCLPRGFLWL